MPTSSQVRVGVRVRPLTSNEKASGGKGIINSDHYNRTINILNRKFTYDAVFDETVSQSEMYDSVGGGEMLDSFLEGYNATIMAYGQTGSGKTYTMGSEADYSAIHSSNSANTECGTISLNHGLIPRFMSDVFSTLQSRKAQQRTSLDTSDDVCAKQQEQNQLIDYKVSASFIEVYGEDIHDLLDDNMPSVEDEDRPSLPLREDGNGGIVVVGVKNRSIASAEEALQVLHNGTLNRTTAATLMNDVSSRSHAVFTIHLHQSTREVGIGGDSDGNRDCLDVTTVSRFTFVDLAGSERMKKTGAEGNRAREGIEINKGLLALGNVINALGDEERLAKGEKVHVPYRQAKLTRLLQDALGGNSQTLFLACISPSDTNASETVSTLQYANRARNIKNAPTKNMDANVAELQRLCRLTRLLECEVVKLRFEEPSLPSNDREEEKDEVDNIKNKIGEVSEELLQRKDVQDYLSLLHEKVNENEGLESKNNNKMFQVPVKQKEKSVILSGISTEQSCSLNAPFSNGGGYDQISNNLVDRRQSTVEEIDNTLLGVNPDEDMALLDKLLELQRLDQEFETENEKDEEKLNQVEGELVEQENLLLQLKQSLKAYHNMKEKFEKLMVEVQSLEAEKASLAIELKRAQVDPTQGCSKAIKKRLQTVETNLSRARGETRKQQQLYRKAEQDAQRCKVLQQKIEHLKQGRVALIKKQREAATRHRESTGAKTLEIQTLKKKERKTGQKMSKLEAEVEKHKVNLNKRKNYCDKMAEKLKQTEMHLMKVLSMRKRATNKRSQRYNSSTKNEGNKDSHQTPDEFEPRCEEIASLTFLLEKLVSDRVSYSLMKSRYGTRVAEYSDLMRSMVEEMSLLRLVQKSLQSEIGDNMDDIELKYQAHKANVEELELKIEVVEADLETIRSRLPKIDAIESGDAHDDKQLKIEEDTMKMVSNLSAPVTKTLLMEVLNNLTASEIDRSIINNTLQRKDAALYSSENEVQVLNERILGLSNDFKKRSSKIVSTEDNEDLQETVTNMRCEIHDLKKSLQSGQIQQDDSKKKLKEANKTIQAKDAIIASMSEKITVMEVAVKNMDKPSLETTQKTLCQLQSVWDKTGVSLKERELVRSQIESCLEDTCARALESANILTEKTQASISASLLEVETMFKALGMEDDIHKIRQSLSTDLTMKQHLAVLQEAQSTIIPTYASAVEHRTKIIEEAEGIIKAMSLPQESLTQGIISVMKYKQKRERKRRKTQIYSPSVHGAKKERAKMIKNVELMMNSLEPLKDEVSSKVICSNEVIKDDSNTSAEDIIDEPNSLSDSYLNQCENDLKELRLRKCEAMVSNQLTREKARNLAEEMHLRGRDLISLSIHSVKKRMKELPKWWEPHAAESVCRTIVGKDAIICVDDRFTCHLETICESLQSISSGRKSLSNTLKEVLKDAQITLLTTVEGEIDASEASSFHGALSRLPPLSKEHIHACIDEINILSETVDAMTQSEIEVLTVVWEALGVDSNQRGNFWGEVEESTKAFQGKTDTPFESVHRACTADIEEWVLTSVKDATKVYRHLSARLFKLRKIHEQVEILRSKQDIKSQILSLDSEIRILSAKLAEFEEKAGSRQRLTKKSNSSSLLKEERFRKQMQASFTTKFHCLGKLLQDWEMSEGANFDAKMLSEDVCKLLDSADDYGEWVKRRTAFMHLKTVKQKLRRKPPSKKDHPTNPITSPDESLNSPTLSSDENSIQTISSEPSKKTYQKYSRTPTRKSNRKQREQSPCNSSVGSSSSRKGKPRIHNRSIQRPRTAGSTRVSTTRSPQTRKGQRHGRGRVLEPCSIENRNQQNMSSSKSSRSRRCAGDTEQQYSKDRKNIEGGNISIDVEESKILMPFGHVLSTTPSEKENIRF